MAMLGMSGLNDIFRGKVRGLPSLNENDQASRVTDNIMSRKLGLKEKGDALKLKFSNNSNVEKQLFGNFKNKSSATFQQYLRVNNKQSQENRVWQMIRPHNLHKDRFSFNEVISPGNTDIVPDTQDVRAWAAETDSVPVQDTTVSDPNVLEQIVPQAKDLYAKGQQMYAAGKEKASTIASNWNAMRPRKKDLSATEVSERLNTIQTRYNPDPAVAKKLQEIELERLQHNADIKYDLKRRELGLLPTRSTTGKGKNRKEIISYGGGGYTGQVVAQQGGPFSSMLPRSAQANWRQYFSQNMPGSAQGIGSAVGGRALANREENILQMTRTTGNPMNVLQATGRTGGSTGQILSTIQSGNVNAFPGNLSGTDKIRWILASPAQREQMLQLLQSQPVQQPVSYTPTEQQPVREVSAQPGKLIYSPQSKKPVAYTRGTYNKNRQ